MLGNRAVRLTAGLNRVSFEIQLSSAGSNTLAAELVAEGDRVPDNNRVQQSSWVAKAPRVLYVEGQPGAARYLRDALASEGIEVSVAAPADIPESAAEFASYDAVILSDAPAKAIAPAKMQAIESYVRDAGGGLLFAAGENVYGEQGYSGTAVEKVLPVQFRAQEKRKDLALVIALDRSYSMRGRKMELAKEATRAALDLLEEQHQFAVVAFDSQTHISVPMQYVRAKRKAEDQIARIQASGQTNIYPALGIVYRLLQKTDAKAKHVILLSDGDTHPADFETLGQAHGRRKDRGFHGGDRRRCRPRTDEQHRQVGRGPRLCYRQRRGGPADFHRGNAACGALESARGCFQAGGQAPHGGLPRRGLRAGAGAEGLRERHGARQRRSLAGLAIRITGAGALAVRTRQRWWCLLQT